MTEPILLGPPSPLCDWIGCEQTATDGLADVFLRPVKSSVWRTLEYVPLCAPHKAEVLRTGRLDLKYEPLTEPSV